MLQDEARFGRISDTRYCWARRLLRPVVKAMLTHQYTYAYGALSPLDGRFGALVLPHVNAECMQLFVSEIACRHPQENIIMVLDGAGWHRGKALTPPDNLRFHFLPRYSPELNPPEHLWDEFGQKHFHNRAFGSMNALEDQLVAGLRRLEQQPQIVRSITAWDWIINSISNAK
jgi:hypothetical protein